MAQKKGRPSPGKGKPNPVIRDDHLTGGLHMRTGAQPKTNTATEYLRAHENTTSPWLAFLNEDVGTTMYYNTDTEETTWDVPADGFQWGEAFPGRTPTVDPEGLGNDYLETPWVKPSLEQAMKYGARGVCLDGRASLWTKISDMNSIGEAGQVYFQFLKTLLSTYFIMSLLYLPTLLSNYNGSKIPGDQLDYTSMLSIANAGTRRDGYTACTSSTPLRSECEAAMWAAGDQFSTSPFWSEGASVQQVATTYVWLDITAMIVFVLAMLHFYVEIKYFARMYRLRTTTVSDYAIQVWGLPVDALESEIIDHFNELYNLQHVDHAGRPPCDPELYPVGHYGNTCDRAYYISWVADCTTAHPTGSAIRKYKQHAHLSLKLRQARATAKRYTEMTYATLDEKKRNEQTYTKWDKRIQQLEWDIMETLRNKQDMSSGSGRNPNETVCAFVVFNNEESAVRAVQDYTGSEYSWNRHFQPKHLKFLEEHPLIVKVAPDPDDILWENLETSNVEIHKRRYTTCMGTGAVLLASFTAIVSALYYAAIFSNNIAEPLMCDSAVPYLYLSSVHNFTGNVSSFASMSDLLPISTDGQPLYIRPPVAERQAKDDACNAGNTAAGTSRWLTLDLSSAEAHFNLAPITYDVSACVIDNKCPTAGSISLESATSNVHCPCVDAAQAELCDLTCPEDAGCVKTFGGKNVANCFCYQAIKLSYNNTGGLTGSVTSYFEQEPMCTEYALLYITGKFLVSSVAYLVTVTNVIIETVVKVMVPYEHPHSVSDLSGAISMKMYLGLALNTVLSPTLAKIRLFDEQANTTSSARTSQVTALPFSGDDKYVGFPVHWYSTVGYTLVSAMVLDIFIPHFIPLMKMCFTKNILRRRKHHAHEAAVTQRQLNALFEGPSFDMATRLGYVLNTCACTISFSSGLPILIPLAMISFFVSFWVDKYMVLRFYKKPVEKESTTIVRAFSTLPFVVLLHFIIALLTLGDSTIFVSEKVMNLTASMTAVNNENVFLGYHVLMLLANAVDRKHMIPAVVSGCIVLTTIVLYMFPTTPLLKLIKCASVFMGRRRRRVSDNNPPFTSAYIKPVLARHYTAMESWFGHLSNCCKYIVNSSMVDGEQHETKLELSISEKMNGWDIKEEKITSQKFKMKEWKNDGYDNQGIKHSAGDLKRTWECIRDDGLYSYKMDQNPQYADAMRTMYQSKKKK